MGRNKDGFIGHLGAHERFAHTVGKPNWNRISRTVKVSISVKLRFKIPDGKSDRKTVKREGKHMWVGICIFQRKGRGTDLPLKSGQSQH